MRSVLRGERDADVPCDGCTGCCVSGYPIPLRPDDRAALERVPARFLSLPVGGGLARMLPQADGTCPMLDAGRCTIYLERPRTCRDYDCRIYAAAGLFPDGQRPVIEQRVAEWRFGFASDAEVASAAAVRGAAQFIRRHAQLFPPAVRAYSATAAAVMAVKAWPVFARHQEAAGAGEPGEPGSAVDAEAVVREILEAVSSFDGDGDGDGGQSRPQGS